MCKEHVIAIIPARGGSVGIPNKNLVPLAGKPLLYWTINQAKFSECIDKVLVSTDSDEISKLALSEGALVVSRPTAISGHNSSSEDAIIHALETYTKDYNINISDITVVFLQATSPLRYPNDIDSSYKYFKEMNYDSLFSTSVASDLTLWTYSNNEWTSANFDYRDRQTRQNAPVQYVENGSIYIFNAINLLDTKNRISGRIGSYVMEPWQVHEIDEQDDLDLVAYYMGEKLIER
ncbi:acylneuraminate cytidylyltransferase family protein [Paracoccaceae bacterium]|nr:acylneuraminate cytidylyltransferase family protein [Paracoccaceae bacterium]